MPVSASQSSQALTRSQSVGVVVAFEPSLRGVGVPDLVDVDDRPAWRGVIRSTLFASHAVMIAPQVASVR